MDKVRALVTVAVAVAVAAGCSGDGDEAEPTIPSTTAPATTEPPTTTSPPTTTDPPTTTAAPTTLPPTTTLDVEALKAQIAADYVAAHQLQEDLVSNPTLDGLEERLAQIAAPGSDAYTDLKAFVEGMVERGERVVNGEPDYSTMTVEMVELAGSPPYSEATVTACGVTNRARVDAAGNVIIGGTLIAIRHEQTVQRTPNGWLPSSLFTGLEQGDGITECPPPG